MTDADLWQSTVNVALVGTERQPDAQLPNAGEISDLLAQVPKSSNEATVLSQAAALSLYRKAGKPVKPVTAQPSVPCESDITLVCSPKAASFLRRLVVGERSEMLPEFLNLLAKLGCRVPDRLLPRLLDLGHKKSELRELILPVVGKRGLWLAEQRPVWKYLRQEVDASVWETGTCQNRKQYLEQLRSTNPELAREQLAETIAQEAAKDRAIFLRTLDLGLSRDDVPFLESMLNDRAQDVRTAALNLLVQLPDCSICQQALETMQQIMTVVRQGDTVQALEIQPPKEFASDLKQAEKLPVQINDSIYKSKKKLGKLAEMLARLVSLVPLSSWQKDFGLTFRELIYPKVESDWAEAIKVGLVMAAIAQKDAAATVELIQLIPSKDIPLFPVLNEAQANAAIMQKMHYGYPHCIRALLESHQYQWDAEVTDMVLRMIQEITELEKPEYWNKRLPDWSMLNWISHQVWLCVDLSATDVIAKFHQLEAEALGTQEAIEKLKEGLQFRQDAVNSLQPDSG